MALQTYLGINETKEIIKASLKHAMKVGPGLYTPLNLIGEKGIGKTAIVKQAVKELMTELGASSRLTILKLSAMQPFTINGYPHIVEREFDGIKHNTQEHATPKFLIDSLGVDWHVVFVDEINRAMPEMHNAIMGLLDGDGINEHVIPKNLLLIAASNPPTDSYSNVTDTEDEAFVERLVHLNIATRTEETLGYMMNNEDIDRSIYNFLNEDRDRIQIKTGFDSPTQHLNPSDRACAKLGRFMPYVKHDRELLEAASKGLLGDSLGQLYCDRYGLSTEDIMSPEDILNKFTVARKKEIEGYCQSTGDAGRLDLVSRVTDGIILYLNNLGRKELNKKQTGNLKKYLDIIPVDLRENLLTKVQFQGEECKNFQQEIIETTSENAVNVSDLTFK